MMFRCGVVTFDIKNVKFNKEIHRLIYANNLNRFSHAFRVNSDVTLQNLILIIKSFILHEIWKYNRCICGIIWKYMIYRIIIHLVIVNCVIRCLVSLNSMKRINLGQNQFSINGFQHLLYFFGCEATKKVLVDTINK